MKPLSQHIQESFNNKEVVIEKSTEELEKENEPNQKSILDLGIRETPTETESKTEE